MNIKNHRQFDKELLSFINSTDFADRWKILERLHIIGQNNIILHFKVHFLMLNEALKQKMTAEIFGQLFRIILILPGHLLGRLPTGNVGTSRVSPFKSMPIPNDLLLELKK